jgi:ribosomal protein S18 acetylase RimI-like enzyme
MRQIRPLGETDRDDILEIAKHTWEGHDYLPYSFESWLRDKNSHTAGIEQDGRVIALANLRVIEDGMTGWMEGLRVHPDYRGKGLARMLTNHVVQTAVELKLQRIRYTTATDNLESMHLGESVGMSRKFNLAVYWHENPKEVKWRFKKEAVKPIEAKDLKSSLIESRLVESGIIVLDWKAVDVTPESLDRIGETARFWVTPQHEAFKAFSLGFSREAAGGKQWQFTIYSRNESSFLSHLSHHLDVASDKKCKTIFGAFQEHYSQALRNLDWTKHDSDDDWALTLLERVL